VDEQAKATLISVARCADLLTASDRQRPCHRIVHEQHGNPVPQIPEPWRGRIDAPLMFVSSNPSLDPGDDSPSVTVSDAELVDYFDRGFPACFPRIRLRNGQVRTRPVYFWTCVLARAAELWQVAPRPGIDFAITELVHCKSLRQRGVKEAIDHCVDRHWGEVKIASKARVFVALGELAGAKLGIKVGTMKTMPDPTGVPRWLLALPHPGAAVPKTFQSCYAGVDLVPLRDALLANRISDADPQP